MCSVMNKGVIYSLKLIKRSLIILGSFENQHMNVALLGITGLFLGQNDSSLRKIP